jgi:hypothetical protein
MMSAWKRRAWFQRVQEAQVARPLGELRAGDPIVCVDKLFGERPALLNGVGAGVLGLPGEALFFIGNAALIRALP